MRAHTLSLAHTHTTLLQQAQHVLDRSHARTQLTGAPACKQMISPHMCTRNTFVIFKNMT